MFLFSNPGLLSADLRNTECNISEIAIPVSDGHKMMQMVVNLKKAYDTKGLEIIGPSTRQ